VTAIATQIRCAIRTTAARVVLLRKCRKIAELARSDDRPDYKAEHEITKLAIY
jgi:hypothetical protein